LCCQFHWELDTTDLRTYSPSPADYPRLPLLLFACKTPYLNQVFWLVQDEATTWQSSSFYHCSTLEDIEALAESEIGHHCRLVQKLPSSLLLTWRAWWLWPHTDLTLPILVPQGSPRQSVQEPQHCREIGIHGLLEAQAWGMVLLGSEVPTGYSCQHSERTRTRLPCKTESRLQSLQQCKWRMV
jgi:hypothetical protein